MINTNSAVSKNIVGLPGLVFVVVVFMLLAIKSSTTFNNRLIKGLAIGVIYNRGLFQGDLYALFNNSLKNLLMFSFFV